MTLRRPEPGEELTVIYDWDGGLSWVAHPDERMHRSSQALVEDGEVWLVDPVDTHDLDDTIADYGEVAGVVVLTNSHGRHADRIAARHDVAIHVPACFDEKTPAFDSPTEPFETALGATGYGLVWECEMGGWREGALYHPDRRTLVIADALVTSIFASRPGQLELFPLFRWSPPRDPLGDLSLDRILLGHGPPVTDDPEGALQSALAVSKPRAAAGIIRHIPTFAKIAVHQVRTSG